MPHLALAIGIVGTELQPSSSVHSHSSTTMPSIPVIGQTMCQIAKSIVSTTFNRFSMPQILLIDT